MTRRSGRRPCLRRDMKPRRCRLLGHYPPESCTCRQEFHVHPANSRGCRAEDPKSNFLLRILPAPLPPPARRKCRTSLLLSFQCALHSHELVCCPVPGSKHARGRFRVRAGGIPVQACIRFVDAVGDSGRICGIRSNRAARGLIPMNSGNPRRYGSDSESTTARWDNSGIPVTSTSSAATTFLPVNTLSMADSYASDVDHNFICTPLQR